MVFSNLQVSAIVQDTTPTNVVTEDANGEATNEQTPVTTDETITENVSSENSTENVTAEKDASEKTDETTTENEDKEKEDTKTTYDYEDGAVKVTATLSDASAIPDDAEFVVTPVTNHSNGYNYQAYMDALNANAEKEHSEKNTLLYDIAFYHEDENKKRVEVQPADGAVTINVSFKNAQLADAIKAKEDADVQVKHLPLTPSVKASVDSTAQATAISAHDVQVENVVANASIGNEALTFSLNSFSVVAVTKTGETLDPVAANGFNLETVLGAGNNYGVIANTYSQDGDTETNLMVGSYASNAFDTGASANYANAGGDDYIGRIVSGTPLRFKLPPDHIYLGDDAWASYEKNNDIFAKDHLDPKTEIVHQPMDVGGIINAIGSNVSSTLPSNIPTIKETVGNDGVAVDITNKGPGTYVLQFDDSSFSRNGNQGFNIKKNADQNIIIYCTSTSLEIDDYQINGVQMANYVADTKPSADGIINSVIFYGPNATSVKIGSSNSTAGVFIFPNATITKDKTCAGILVANSYNCKGGEWHYHNHHLVSPTNRPKTKTSVSVKKEWYDSNNKDGKRPDSVTVHLFADGEDTNKTVELNADNNWNGSFTDLDSKKSGKAITYTVQEDKVDGYDASISGNATDGFTITNTHKTETVDISGTKTWKDNDNQDGKRPDKITVTLMANGEDVQSKEIAGDWTYKFNNLPKYDNGKEIKYTIKEDKVAGYTSEVKGYDLINTHKTETTSISVKKQWDDTKNQDGKRPTEVTVHLYADGKDTGKTVELNADNHWKASFNDLDVNKDGKAIEYTVKEDEVKDYEASTSGDAKSGFVLTNSHKTETVNISGTKTWADNDNQDGARPDSITIRLMADGKEIQKQEVKADKDGNWTYAFNDLPKYANGQEITYTVSEDAVKDYTTTQKGNDFTNTHKVGKTSVSVKKIWKDSNNQDGIRPEKITVKLLANGEKTDKTLTLDEKNNWSGSFTDLDAKKKGKDIQYSIAEVSVPKGYKSIITGDATKGYIVTNTHTTHRTTTGKKTNHTSGTNTGMETNVRFYSLSTIVSLLAIAFFRRRFVK